MSYHYILLSCPWWMNPTYRKKRHMGVKWMWSKQSHKPRTDSNLKELKEPHVFLYKEHFPIHTLVPGDWTEREYICVALSLQTGDYVARQPHVLGWEHRKTDYQGKMLILATNSPLMQCQVDLSWPSVFVHCKRLKASSTCLTKRAIHWFRSLSSSKGHLPQVRLDPTVTMLVSNNYSLFSFRYALSCVGFLVNQSQIIKFQFLSLLKEWRRRPNQPGSYVHVWGEAIGSILNSFCCCNKIPETEEFIGKERCSS